MSDQQNSTTLVPSRPRSLTIKGLTPSLPERGKIKIGGRGAKVKSRTGTEFQPPLKFDHFVVTTVDRGPDGNFRVDEALHKLLGEAPKDIKVRLIYDAPELNFPTRYAAYMGRKLWCAGDGEYAERLNADGKSRQAVQCPCPRKEPGYSGNDKCKMNGVLGVLIDGAGGVGGVWKFRTTSWNTINGILSSMAFIKGVSGGVLANIPLTMSVRPKQASAPDGQQQTIYVVSLEFAGDMPELQQIGHKIALDRATTHMSIELIEHEARRLLAPPTDAPLPGDDAEEIAAEFYHDATVTTEGQLSAFAGAGEGAPEPETVKIDLFDDQGVFETGCTSAQQWGAELLASATHPRKGHGYLRSNRPQFEIICEAMTQETGAKLIDLYNAMDAAEPEAATAAPAGAPAAAPPKAAAPAPAAAPAKPGAAAAKPAAAPAPHDPNKPAPLPMVAGKVSVSEYVKLINGEINAAATKAAVDFIIARELPRYTEKHIPHGPWNGVTMRAKQRIAEIEAAPAPASAPVPQSSPPPADRSLYHFIRSDKQIIEFSSAEEMTDHLTKMMTKATLDGCKAAYERTKPILANIEKVGQIDSAQAIRILFEDKIQALTEEPKL